MYLEKLTVKNFKCFSNQELPLRKITLLLGANSAGKSSLLYAILAALQSDQFPLALSTNGPLVDLGDFTSIVFAHKKNLSIGVGLEFSAHDLGTCSFSGSFRRLAKSDMPAISSSRIADPSLRINVTRTSKYQARWVYDAKEDPVRANLLETGDARELFQSLDRILRDVGKVSGRNQKSASFIDSMESPPAVGKFGFTRLEEFVQGLAQPKYIILYTHLTSLLTGLSTFRSGFNYIGSVRLEPLRSYYYASQDDLKIGRYGQNYVEQIAKWQEERSKEMNQLKHSLRSLRLVSNIQASRLRNGNFEIRIRPRKASMTASLADVGLGIAELLPILVADLQLPVAGTLAVSQPESHLHPSAQADLASYVVRRVRSAKTRYIIETHSEYFINRLRLLVAQGKLSSDELSIVYLSNDGEKSSAYPIRFLTSGKIEGAPKEFFQTYMMDVLNIALSAAP